MFLDEVGKTRNLLTADIHGSTRIKICLPANAWASAPRWTFSLQFRLENAQGAKAIPSCQWVRFPNEPGEKKVAGGAHAFKSQESNPRESVKIRGLKLYSLKT
jgi:hypothetical protein